MKSLERTILFILCLSLFFIIQGCGGGSDAPPAAATNTPTTPDNAGDTETTIDANPEDDIFISFTLKELPSTLTCNKPNTVSGFVEYMWAVKFDANNDGEHNAGDLILYLASPPKPEGNPEPVDIPIADFNTKVAWMTDIEGNGTVIYEGTKKTVSIPENTITLSFNKTELSELANLSLNTPLVFNAVSVIESGDWEMDVYPEQDPNNYHYAEPSEDGNYTDAQDDVSLAHIDMVTMRVTVK